MQRAIYIVLALISAAILGVAFIAPEQKAFSYADFYQPDIQVVDYKALNDQRNYTNRRISEKEPTVKQTTAFGVYRFYSIGTLISGNSDLTSIFTVDTDKLKDMLGGEIQNFSKEDLYEAITKYNGENIKRLYLNYERTGLLPASDSIQDASVPIYPKDLDIVELFPQISDSKMENLLSKSYGMSYYQVPYGMQLIAPSDIYVLNAAQPNDGAYPEEKITRGTYIKGIMVGSDNHLYEILITSLDRLWMNREQEHANKNTTSGYTTEGVPSDELFIIGAQCVIGFAGLSGIPKSGEGIQRDELFAVDNPVKITGGAEDGAKAVVGISVRKSNSTLRELPDNVISKLTSGKGLDSSIQFSDSSLHEFYNQH